MSQTLMTITGNGVKKSLCICRAFFILSFVESMEKVLKWHTKVEAQKKFHTNFFQILAKITKIC